MNHFCYCSQANTVLICNRFFLFFAILAIFQLMHPSLIFHWQPLYLIIWDKNAFSSKYIRYGYWHEAKVIDCRPDGHTPRTPPPHGNFADIPYLKEQSFLHRIRDVALCKSGRKRVTANYICYPYWIRWK